MRLLTATLLLLMFAGQPALADELPSGVIDTQNPADVSLTPQESLARITVPAGFQVTLFAGEPDVRRPIAFDFDDRGRLWVVENYSHPEWSERGNDRIVILEDTDNDGHMDRRKVFWDKGRYLTAIAFGHGGVWVGNTPELQFIPDRDGDDIPDSEPEVKLDGFRISNHNNVINNFHWGPDGWLYGARGEAGSVLVGPPGTEESKRVEMTRGIWRYHPYTGKFEVLAHGMVNPWGADFNEFGDLFTSNTVIAHLWHIVPGMYCQRRGFERDNPYAYGRIQSIADHMHWAGGNWQSSRVVDEDNHDAGGGHAHCGGMIYLGDNWPDEYRGTFFTGNLHGNRINNDRLVPRGSSYLGVHRPDFLFANDAWFRSMTQKYGPDGGVFVSDWHDFGECHDKDGSHRSSGRIYKVVYGRPNKPISLYQRSSVELAELHSHDNEWIVRHARRILHERAVANMDISDAAVPLRDRMRDTKDSVQRLRCLWTLNVTKSVSSSELRAMLKDEDPHLRRWSVKLLVDSEELSNQNAKSLAMMAADEPDPRVRLSLACAMPRFPAELRWEAAKGLLSHAEDGSDPYLPLMIWYGIEPLVAQDTSRGLALAASARIPLVQRYIVRRLCEKRSVDRDKVFATLLGEKNEDSLHAMLIGVAEAFEDRMTNPPARWIEIRDRRSSSAAISAAIARIAVALGDEQAIGDLRGRVLDQSETGRIAALETLLRLPEGVDTEFLHDIVVRYPELRSKALKGLATRANSTTGDILLQTFRELSNNQRYDAVLALTSRSDASLAMLRHVKRGEIRRDEISAYALDRLKSNPDSRVKELVHELFPADSSSGVKSELVSKYRQLLTKEFVENGDAANGRQLFEQTCAKCHRLFGEGSDLAPDLTGSGRKNIDYLLSNLIDPSGLVDDAYRLTTLITDDGRVISGFMIQHGEKHVQLRTQDGEQTFATKDIESIETSKKSMMPDGLLQTYTEEQVRDLVRYLTADNQVAISVE